MPTREGQSKRDDDEGVAALIAETRAITASIGAKAPA
jgi:hypothetical protein